MAALILVLSAAILVLSAALCLALADAANFPGATELDPGAASLDQDFSEDISRPARAWIPPPEMIAVSVYWKNYAKRRNNALNRCETRLNFYISRRKMAQELMASTNVVSRRNALAMKTDIEAAQEKTKATELALTECLQQLIQLQGDDPFYRDYQQMSSIVQRLTDQVDSCAAAGGKITLVKRGAETASAQQHTDLLRSLTENASMLRVFENARRDKAIKEAEKRECFDSLAIPPTFPVQIESAL